MPRYWKWSELFRSLRWSRRYLRSNTLNELNVGNEVAEFVRDHLIDELKVLSTFKNGDYEQALKDIHMRMDEMLKTSFGKQKL
jgi:hypothetical protein